MSGLGLGWAGPGPQAWCVQCQVYGFLANTITLLKHLRLVGLPVAPVISQWHYFHYILYHSNQFSKGCDLWQACQNFGFGNLPNLSWHVQIFGKFSAVLRRRRRKISILGTWSLNEFSTLQKLPWPPWHFSVLKGLVMCDCQIDLNGTVYVNLYTIIIKFIKCCI